MPERTLILLRHAKSDWSGGEADVDRPLNKRGLREAPIAGAWVAGNIGRVDAAVVSPANRTRSTWKLVSAELDGPPPARFDDVAYGASPAELLDILRGLPDDARTVIVVGHNPGIEGLASLLTNGSVSMATSALAVIGFDAPWSSLDASPAVMRAFGRPPAPLPVD
ncbi:SixA phosphatase family protein [Cryobacterium roopkundense]|nr:histidine phosphatase family protein [Cryobacterium roopkundense]